VNRKGTDQTAAKLGVDTIIIGKPGSDTFGKN
jgi:hypothetical protein